MADTAVLNLAIRTKKALSDLDNFNSKLGSVGKTLSLKVSAPLLALEGIAIKTFAEMESGLTNVTNLLDRDIDFNKFSNELKVAQEEAVELGFSINDVNKSLFDNVSALGQGEVALESYKEAQKLAIAGNAQLSETVDGITSIVNAYGKEFTKANEVSSAFFIAQKVGKTNISELSRTIGKVAPIARAAGVGYEELLSTMSVLTKGGLSTAEATTALKGAINSIINPSEQAHKELEKLGIANSITKLKSDGLTNTFVKLNKAFLNDNDIITKLIPNQEALVAVAGLNQELLELSVETQEKMNQQRGEGHDLNEAYTASLDDFDRVLLRLTGTVKTLGADIGELLLDGLDLKNLFKEWGAELKYLKEDIKNMSDEDKQAIINMAKWAIILPPAIVAIAGVGNAVVTTTKAIKALTVASMKNPISATVIAGFATGAAAAKFFNDAISDTEKKLTKLQALTLRDDIVDILGQEDAENRAWELQKRTIEGTFRRLDAEEKITKEKKKQADIERMNEDELNNLGTFLDEMMMNSDIVNALSGFTSDTPDLNNDGSTKNQFADAVEQGSIEALKLENQEQNKVQESQLKELKKQTKSLKEVADNKITVNEVNV